MITQNLLTLDLSKIPAQKAFMESVEHELLYSGAYGAGKSRIGCEKGLYLSLKYPGNIGIIARKTFKTLRTSTLATWERDVCPRSYYKLNQETMIMTLINGSKILWLGLDDELKLGSTEAGWIFIDEAIELDEDDYRMLLGRLRLTNLVDNNGNRAILPFRQLFCATNPGAPEHWLYNRAYTEKQMHVLESNTLDNPFLPQDYKDSLSKFKGVYYDRYVLGKWVGGSGLVYDCFDPKQHVIDNFDIPQDWSVYRGIDFGFSNPFSCVWVAIHPENKDCTCKAPKHDAGTCYIYKEIYMSQRTVDQHARHIIEYSRNDNIKGTFSDHAAGDRAILELNGVPTYKADKNISAGIQSVYNLIAQDKLYIFKQTLVETDPTLLNNNKHKPTRLLEEIASYNYPDSSKRRALGNNKEEPVDKDNHALDALRYVIHTLALKQIADIAVISVKQSGLFKEEIFANGNRWSQPGLLERIPGSRWT